MTNIFSAFFLLLVALVFFVGLVSTVAFASGSPPRNALYDYTTAAGGAIIYAFFFVVALAIANGRFDLLSLRRPHSWPRALAIAAPLFIGVYAVIFELDRILHGAREQGLVPVHWESRHAGAYAANFVVVAVVAPIVEETLFRGLGYSLFERFGRWQAIVAIGIAFGIYHGLPQAFPELALFGSALAWLRWKTGSVFPGMLAHAALNAIALTSVFFAS
jgi:membrane protease YdiL (CAAX protease family)